MSLSIHTTNDLIEQQMNAGIQHICGTEPVFNLVSHSSHVHLGVGCAIVFFISFILALVLFMQLGNLSDFGYCLLLIAAIGCFGSLDYCLGFSDEIVVSDSEYNQKFKTYNEQKELYDKGIKACSQKVKEKWNVNKSGEENIKKIKSEVNLTGDLR
ncbi:hypothetical protein FAI40_08080 [Acetobacteraceae bacterium]|nr:hypothetical protein FAI40_08080 [Acetobacteraceae bacterium]